MECENVLHKIEVAHVSKTYDVKSAICEYGQCLLPMIQKAGITYLLNQHIRVSVHVCIIWREKEVDDAGSPYSCDELDGLTISTAKLCQ